jgi:prepilin-type N-terminal cleavage/methylation domain-containing protein
MTVASGQRSKVRSRRSDARPCGFTIIEMLIVMGIMVILMTIAVASWFGLRRGAEMRGAINSVKTTLDLARQQAVTRQKNVAVVYRQNISNATIYVFEKGGRVAAGDHTWFNVADGSLLPQYTHTNEFVCSIRVDPGNGSVSCGMGTVLGTTTNQPGVVTVRLNSRGLRDKVDNVAYWELGDEYGWAAHAQYNLPPAIQFGSGLPQDAPDPVLLSPDGRAGGLAQVDIRIQEKIGDPVPQKAIITLYPLTGITRVTFPAP